MQPSSKQWAVIWAVAILVVLAWPPDTGNSLGVTLVRWAADPRGTLPTMPAALPMSMDDDGDAVTAYDMQRQAYDDARRRSTVTRWRQDLVEATDPFAPATQRQLLVGVAVAAALLTWRMGAGRTAEPS